MQTVLNSPVLLAIIAAICYGVGGPLMKLAGQHGATPNGLAFMYALGAALFAVNWTSQTVLFSSVRGVWFALAMGVLFGLAFRTISLAFTLPTGYISIVLVAAAAYPLISSVIGLTLLGEADKVLLTRLVIGSLLTILGVYLVSTSIK